MKKLTILMTVFAGMLACGGGDEGKSSGKKLGAPARKTTDRPDSAQAMGESGSGGGRGGAPGISTEQEGDTGDEVYCWDEDIDDDGEVEDCCVTEDDETGESIADCLGYTVECDDGSTDEGVLITFEASDGSGTFAIFGDDICGLGSDIAGCDYDSSFEVISCGECTVDEELVCEDDGFDEDEECPEGEDCEDPDEECPEGEDCEDPDEECPEGEDCEDPDPETCEELGCASGCFCADDGACYDEETSESC